MTNLPLDGYSAPTLFVGNAGVLRGDTVRVRASYCAPNSSCVDTATARWRSNNPSSVAFLVGNVPVAQVDSAHSVLVRGVKRGVGGLAAAHVGSSATGNGFIAVADSSDITRLRIVRNDGNTLRVGEAAVFTVFLYDVYSQGFRGAPTAWSVSDTTVSAVTQTEMRDGWLRLTVVGRTPGTADLRVHFLAVTEVTALTVVP